MEKLANEFYGFLRTNGYFKKLPEFDPEVEWLIRNREVHQVRSSFRLLSFLDPPDRFFDLCKQGDSFEHFEKETEVMLYSLLTNIALSQYETLKRVFCFALDLKKINPALNDNSTYGMIIGGLEQKDLEKNIICVLDNRLRNIVAHGDWYVLDGRFAYMDDEKQTMSYEDLWGRVKNFSIFSDEFYELYWPEYAPPEYIQFKRQKLAELTRKLFLKPDQQQKK